MHGGYRLTLGTTFDDDAPLYDRARPTYPDAVFDAISSRLGRPVGRTPRVLEIGCGTGLATLPLAERGYRVLAVDLGADMVAVARRNLAAFPLVNVVHADADQWNPPTTDFDLVLSATAFHWLDPAHRLTRVAGWLRPGGLLALIQTVHIAGPDDAFFADAQRCYEQFDPGTPPGLRLPCLKELPDAGEYGLERAEEFHTVELRRFAVDHHSTAERISTCRAPSPTTVRCRPATRTVSSTVYVAASTPNPTTASRSRSPSNSAARWPAEVQPPRQDPAADARPAAALETESLPPSVQGDRTSLGVGGRDRGHTGDVPLLRLGPVSVPSPDEVVDTTRSVLGWGSEVVALGASLPSRVDALIVEVERLVTVLGRITERVDGLIDRADTLVEACDSVIETATTITAGASEVVEASRGITVGATEVVDLSRGITTGATEVVELSRNLTAGAGEVMDRAGLTSTAAQELLDLYRPMLERGAPLAGRFVDDLTPEEIDAAIKLVDQLPVLTQHMVSDIMPILETLDRVGPDISELLGVTKDLRQGLAGIPGLSFLVKRGAGKEED